MIELKDITKKYGKKVIFQNFNLKVKEGEMIAIIGPSGSGKSTLLNIIGLIESFNSGEYTCMGYKNVKPNSSLAQKIIRNDISYLFQNFALIEDQSVLSNLLLALKYVHQKKEEKVKLIKKALTDVGLQDYLNSKIFELSGGQQQRVAVARAIIKPSKIVLADEPTGSLDIKNRNEIFKLLVKLNNKGKTIVIVTHDIELAQKCPRVVVLSNKE
ncbi:MULTISPECIES: putative bacteriocin export ABC transporter [Bacilli]|uniref:putative bacteriocin export ABC transporter n=1 Tax=Bacilli TaxID=91061 RepID=UPI000E48EDE1|nr:MULTISPECIES: putative bacteriocin export ABC transporter [Lactobacillus]NLS86391.1 ABC transporter ATP-binding protein [Oscillospiraceae bacterium]MBM6974028.1 ABC transporter ATP-binding protein [Lactobacillus gallinarum]MDB6221670.1 putative bacteriocin export ABC transporter [Lactobacillus amylovorus]MDB6227221.1 putative bacteriocin export ABC transporter [Lactobacillus amylovorus]MDB6230742.1 putative bacteriocin export ABC transporter [Lactobacillus amylovorus]